MKPTTYWGFSGDVCEFYMITITCPPIFSCSVIHQIYFSHCLQEFQYRFEECRHLWTQKVCFRFHHVQQAPIFIIPSFQRCIFQFCIHHKLSPSTIRQNQISKCMRCPTYRVAYEIKRIVDNWMCIYKNGKMRVNEYQSTLSNKWNVISFLMATQNLTGFWNPRMHVAYALE
jgi:hypothetical protein